MTNSIIQIQRLGKQYRIGVQEPAAQNWREALVALAGASFRYLRQMTRPPTEEESLWAIRDISFDIERGEVVGIIGRNGAGKSTLLKILSRITEPTEGRAIIHGRMGSLLEVGTGFHPELTGRENIYLNGTILGMRRREIDRRFDEIVEFAEVEKFIDTPVKRYSSGMHVRLAFAVAAHLESEILIVDEVLAVGDLRFQKKCLGKMESVSHEGRTILFVSHNMSAITSLCETAVLMDGGRIARMGPVDEVVNSYVQESINALPERVWDDETAPGNDVARVLRVRAQSEDNQPLPAFDIRRPIAIEMLVRVDKPEVWFAPSVQVINESGLIVLNSVISVNPFETFVFNAPGTYRVRCWVPGNFLAEGLFSIRASLWGFSSPPKNVVRIDDAVRFNVYDNVAGDSVRGKYTGHYPGIVRPMLDWDLERVSADLEDQAQRPVPARVG